MYKDIKDVCWLTKTNTSLSFFQWLDVVEMHDVTAKDPGLLVLLKSSRNTVPVPRHWCFKRKYLQGKRGIEKPPFELPGNKICF